MTKHVTLTNYSDFFLANKTTLHGKKHIKSEIFVKIDLRDRKYCLIHSMTSVSQQAYFDPLFLVAIAYFQYSWHTLFADFFTLVLLTSNPRKYTKIRYSVSPFAGFDKICILLPCSAPSLFVILLFAVLQWNESTSNYEGRLYYKGHPI